MADGEALTAREENKMTGDAFSMLQEKMPHGDAMFPLKVHEVCVDSSFEEKVSCHWHEEMEILVITAGQVDVFIDEECYKAEPGDMLFIRPDSLHSLSGQKGEEVAFFAIDFKYELLDSFWKDTIQQKYLDSFKYGRIALPVFIRPDEEWQREVYRLTGDIRRSYAGAEMGYELLIKARLYEILYLLCLHGAKPVKEEVDNGSVRVELMKEIIAYMQDNYAGQITLEELAERFHVSDGHLCRLFKSVTRMTMTEYLNHYRVSQSVALLGESERGIGEIAGMVGFNNISYYNKIFRKYMHMTPKEYRALQRTLICSPNVRKYDD